MEPSCSCGGENIITNMICQGVWQVFKVIWAEKWSKSPKFEFFSPAFGHFPEVFFESFKLEIRHHL